MFKKIQGVEIIMDDILVWGENLAEHNFRLECVLKRAKEKNGTKSHQMSVPA